MPESPKKVIFNSDPDSPPPNVTNVFGLIESPYSRLDGSNSERSPLIAPFLDDQDNDEDQEEDVLRNSKWKSLKQLFRTRIRYYVPVLAWAPKYAFDQVFKQDLIAGISVAFLIIPQGLSFAQALVKIPPIHGLYTAFIPLILYTLLGTSKHMAIGPEALVSILVGASVKEWFAWKSKTDFVLINVEERIGIATLMCLMVGIFTFILGFFRLGFLDSVLSRALLRGFVLAVACVVMIDMANTLLGIKETPTTSDSESPVSKLLHTLQCLKETHILTFLISAFSISYLFGLKYLKSKYKHIAWISFIPDILVLVFLSTVLCSVFRWDLLGVEILDKINPSATYIYPKIPPISMDAIRFLTLSSILISVIGFVESIAAAKIFSAKYNYPVSPNRELVAIGTANIISSFFGGYPAFGSLGRSAVNEASGAKTQLAGGITGLIVLMVSLWFLPLFEFLPKSVCSSIIVVAAANLVELHDVWFIIQLRAWKDLGLLCLTFLSTLFISIESGTLISVAISLLLVVQHTTKTRLAILGQTLVINPATGSLKPKYRSIQDGPSVEPLDSFLIIRIEEGLFFGNSGQLKERLKRIEVFGDLSIHPGEEPITISEELGHKELKAIIFDMAAVTNIDATATQILLEMVQSYLDRGISICFVKLRDNCRSKFKNAGIYSLLGPHYFFRKIQDAIDSYIEAGLLRSEFLSEHSDVE